MSSKSRLSRRLEKQTTRSFLLMLFGTFLILILFIRYGLPALANLSIFISGFNTNQTSAKKSGNVYVQPPLFNPIVNGTNSAQLVVSGQAFEKQTIKLYLNDDLSDTTKTNKDGFFQFENITLKSGENRIKAKAVTEDNKESDFSTGYTIFYKNTPPSLSIDSPKDNQSFSKDDNMVTVAGKTDSKVTVTINDFRAIVDDDGKFSYHLPLKNGENKIVIVALDDANNKTQIEKKVTYNP